MSKTVDERVVSMQFDNKQFEANVATSMSTLDKLKQKLNLSGASKGLDNVNSAAKNVNMSPLASAVDTVRTKFSALEVMGVTALANITNSAVNAGKMMVKALAIDPITSGFSEYETQINAVQTILANTQKEGTNVEIVNKALDELNTYADKTIYNFTEMTRNIGTFTAAGVKLDTSVSAIQGIANLAAVSGSTSQQASTAMYQLSQALAAGTVKLMDWNSVVNAGMGGQVFQDALKKTSELLGTGAEAAIKAKGSFRESLQTGWLTAEVLTETLKKFTTSGAAEYLSEFTGLSQDVVDSTLKATDAWGDEADAIDKAAEALAKKSGKNKDEIKDALLMAKNAEEAATKVKTFSQLWDVLKESAQSGWAQTWRLLVGDFEEAKGLLTPLADFLTGIIQGISDARNKLLEGALGSPFKGIVEKFEKVTEATEKVSSKLTDLGDIVNEVIGGKWGNGQARWDKLTEAGYNWAEVQNKVNEELDCSVRHSLALGKSQENLQESEKSLNKTQTKTIEQLIKMNDEQLKALGLTKDEIKSLRDLEETAKKAGIPLKDVLEDISLLDGRNLLINSFKNIGKVICDTFGAIKEAWQETFNPIMTSERLYDIIAAFHKFTTNLQMSDETLGQLKTTFKGLFAALDIVLTLVGGPLKVVFKILKQLLGAFDLNVLDVTESIALAIIRFRDWLDETLDFTAVFEAIVPYIKLAGEAIRNFISSVKDSETVKKIAAWLKEAGEGFREWIAGIKEAENIPKYILGGLVNGIKNGAIAVWNAIVAVATGIITKICNVLGIHSPSTVMTEVGENTMAGLGNGIQNGFSKVWETIKNVASKIVNFFKNIDWGTVLAFGITGTSFVGVIKVLSTIDNALEVISAPLEGLGDVLTGLGASFKADAWKKKSEAIRNIAISIGILVASLYVLTKLCEGSSSGDLWEAVGVLAALSLIVVGLAVACDKLNKSMTTIDKSGIKSSGSGSFGTIIAIGAALFLMVLALKKIASMNINNVWQSVGVLTALMGEILLMVLAFSKLAKYSGDKGVKNVGRTILSMSVALLIMTTAMKTIAKMTIGEIAKGVAVIAAFGALLVGFVAISKFAGEHSDKAGKMLLKMSIAMLILVAVVKMVGGMSIGEIVKGLAFIAAVETLFGGIIALSKFAGEHASKAGSMLLQMSIAILIVTYAIEKAADMSMDDIAKGLGVIAAVEVLFGAIIAVSKFAGQYAARAGAMLFLMSGAILILTGAIYVLSRIEPAGLDRALAAITLLESCFAGLIAVTAIAKDSKGMTKVLTTMTLSIALMAVAIAALSFIEPKKLAVASAALSMVMSMFAGMIAVTKLAKNTKEMIRTLAVLSGVTLLLAGIIVGLSYLNPDSALKNTAALSLLLLSFSGALLIINQMNNRKKFPTEALKSMLLVVAGLAVILGVMSALSVGDSIETAASLSLVLLAMTAAMVILSNTKSVSKEALIGMAVLGVVMAEIAAVFGLLKLMNVAPSLESALALSTVLLAMSAACLIVSMVPFVAALYGALGLAAFIGILTGVLATLGGLNKIPGFQEFIKGGGEVLVIVGRALGDFVGSIIEGIGKGISSVLPAIGESLSAFMKAAKPFFDGLTNVKDDMLKKVAILAAAVIALSVASFYNAVANFLSMGTGFVKMGLDLSAFIIAALPFIKTLKDLPNGFGENVKSLADGILAITKASVLDGISSLLGISSLDEFGIRLTEFGEALGGFCKAVSEGVNMEDVTLAANAGKAIASMMDAIDDPTIFDLFPGGDKLSNFSEGITNYGIAIKSFSDSVKGTSLDVDAMYTAVNAGKALAEMAKTAPEQSTLDKWLPWGKDDFGTFADNVAAYGLAIKSFSDCVKGANFDTEAIYIAVNAGKALAEMAKTAPEQSALDKWLPWGKDDFGTFADNVSAYGLAIKSFSESVNGAEFDTDAMYVAVNAGKALAEMAKTAPEQTALDKWLPWGKDDFGTFADNVTAYGLAIKSFSDCVKGSSLDIDAMYAAVNAGKALAEMADTVPERSTLDKWLSISDFTAFSSGITSYGAGICAFSKAIEGMTFDNAKITAATNAGIALADMANSVPDVGFLEKSDLSKFSTGIVHYAEGIVAFSDKMNEAKDTIDVDFVNSIVGIGNRISAAVAAYPDNGDISDVTNGLKDFGKAIVDFSDQIKGKVKVDEVTPVVDAAKTLSDAAARMPDEVNLGKLTTGLDKYATSIIDFSSKINHKLDVNTVTTATTIGKNIVDMFQNVTGYGITNLDLTSFADSLDEFGTAIVDFSNTVGNGGVSTTTVDTAKDVTASIKSIVTDLSNTTFKGEVIDNVLGKLSAIALFVKNFAIQLGASINTTSSTNAKTIVDNVKSIVSSLSNTTFDNEVIDKVLGKLSTIAKYITDFVTQLGYSLDPTASTNASTVVKNVKSIVSSLSNTIFDNEVIDKVLGKLSSIALFIKNFVMVLGTTIDPTTSTNASTVVDNVKSIVSSLSNTTFDNEVIDKVLAKLSTIALFIKNFVIVLGTTIDPTTSTNAKTIVDNVKSIVTSLSNMEFNNEHIDLVLGKLSTIALFIKNFVIVLGTTIDPTTSTNAKTIVDNVKSIVSSLSNTTFDNEKITNVLTRLRNIAMYVTDFASKISGIESGSAEEAKKVVGKIVEIIKSLSSTSLGGDEIDTVISNMGRLGQAILKFAGDVSINGVPDLSEFTSQIESLAESLSDSDAFESAGESAISSVINGMTTKMSASIKKFVGFGSDIAKNISKGITDSKSSVSLAFTIVLTHVKRGISDKKSSFESAGKDLGDGLVKGINAKQDAAYNAGYKLGQKAVQGEKDGQKSASPSKLTIRAGKWLGEGLIIGIEKMGRAVYKSGYGLGKTATDTITSSVSTIADAINTDIDSQPTIRPVLDLSDVRSGASTIGGLFDTNPSVGVLANVGAISSMMNRNGQNGGNAEVVSAIDKLRKDLGNVGNTTYNVNGVTYDDGSNVKGAVEQIVRAARIGRRV